MKNYEDRELSSAFHQLAAQIPVPAAPLLQPRGSGGSRFMAVAGAVAALVLAVVIGLAIGNLRQDRERSVATTGTPTPAGSPTPSASAVASATPAPLAFPDTVFVAGTFDGFLYRIQSNRVSGAAVDTCHGQPVTGLQFNSSGRLLLVTCAGPTQDEVLLVDASTLARRAGPLPATSGKDLAAWSPDEKSIAFLQTGSCASAQAVCQVHVVLWDVASGSTRIIRPDEPLTTNLRWTAAGLSVSYPQGPQPGTVVWDGQAWKPFVSSQHQLWIADDAGNALLVEAGTGSTGGRVWERRNGQERRLTAPLTDTEYPLALLAGGRAAVWRDEPRGPGGAVLLYQGQQMEHMIPDPGFCGAAQQVGSWLICTTPGKAALAFSLDTNTFAHQPIEGLGAFNALAVLPK
jgi:hypothetical protein